MESTKFKVFTEEKSQSYGRFFLEPLERGYGDTLGNALRRLLLSSIRGAAVTAVKIDGVLHEFSTIKGIREDVIEILTNLKHIPIKAKTNKVSVNEEGFKIITLDSDDLPKDFFTRAENPGVITARDMPWDNDFEFCGDGVLCTLEPGSHLLMEIYVEQGTGYLSAERERPAQPPLPINAMLADAIFSPVNRVNYQIEPARVGQSIDFERLILEVWTNGAVTPEEAVAEAAGIARSYFGQIADTVDTAPQKARPAEPAETTDQPGSDDPTEPLRKLFDRPIHELELSIRSENCLLRGGIQTIGDLLQKSRDDLLKIRNLGKKSLTEIEEKITSCGYSLQPSKSGKGDADDESAAEESKD
ncbi:MAG: DNA-directed RNA polymerase subunit alpha [Synergistaceae bacterium]|nr:DNA-directed RNA polymerase subunit alpha [Synergistaceae bacterium]